MNPQQKRKLMRPAVKEGITGYLFAAPAIVGFLVLTLYPMLASLYYSFNDIKMTDSVTTMTWVGFGNYIEAFTNPSLDFQKSIIVTLLYAFINVILVIVFCLIVALLLNRKFRGRNLLRALFFLPSVIPVVASGLVWKMLMQNQAQGGLVNWFFLKILNISPVDFINSPMIYVTLFLMSLWTCGGTTVVLIATLQDVPKDQLESIEIDGGNAWHKFIKVTYPTIKPVLFFQMIMCMMTSLQVYAQSLVFSKTGAPDHLTYFLNIAITQLAFKESNQRGIAAAEAWVVFLIILVITGIMFYFQGALKKDDSMGPRKKKKTR